MTKPPVFLSFGYIASFVTGPNPAIGHGAEVSLMSFLDANDLVGIGPVLQYQSYGEPQHGRLGAGIGASFFVGGLDLLYSYRESAAEHEGTHGLTVGPYLTFLGIVHAAGRFTMALSPASEAGWGNEYGLTLGVKLPLLVAGDFWNVGHGRPLLVNGCAVTAALSPSASLLSTPSLSAPSATLLASIASLEPEERSALGQFWCRVAEEEHASIAAFNALSLRLLAQGAPAELLLGCQQAARDEIRHAALARELAETFTAQPLHFEALPSALDVTLSESVPQLALAALLEGCVAEGTAAEVLALAAQEAHSAELRAVLRSVASDEKAHADLAWAIVEYCLLREPQGVAEVLLSWLAEAPPALAAQAPGSPPLPRGYGAVARANQQKLSYGTWANTTLRLHVALGLDVLAA